MSSYSTNPKVYWATWIYIIVYVILTAIWLSVFIQNNAPIYTWFANLGAPGSSLVSYRNTFLSISVRLAIIAHIMAVPLIMGMIYTRDNRAGSITFFVFYLICLILTLISVAATGSAYGSCNTEFGNLCNSPQFCCVNVGVAGCNNPLPCPGVLPTDLTPNIEFLGLFWMNFVLFLLQLLFVGFAVFLTVSDSAQPAESVDLAEEEPLQPPAEPPQVPAEQSIPPVLPTPTNVSTMIRRTHGLKQRK